MTEVTDWPGATARPRRRDGTAAVSLDDNVALYDDVGQLLILLNPSAAAVWQHCDGSTSFDDMVGRLVASYAGDPGLIRQDVRETLRKLRELGLVDDGPLSRAVP